MERVFSLSAPSVALFSSFASSSVCRGLIDSSRPLLVESTVIDNDTGASILNNHRSSSTAYLGHEWDFLTAHIASVFGFSPESGERPQIQRYGLGQQYKPHHDYFCNKDFAEINRRGGQRVATAILYLNTVPFGGGTEFPELGITVSPVEGFLLFFRYRLDDGSSDPRLFHAGLPVLAGEKFILTQWFREGTYCE